VTVLELPFEFEFEMGFYPAKNIMKNQEPTMEKERRTSSVSTSPTSRNGMLPSMVKFASRNKAFGGDCG